MTTPFIAVIMSIKLISGFQMVYCAQAECLYLLIWEKLPFALGGQELFEIILSFSFSRMLVKCIWWSVSTCIDYHRQEHFEHNERKVTCMFQLRKCKLCLVLATWQLLLISIWLAPWAGKMNHIASCDWLLEQGKIELSCPLGITSHLPHEKFPLKPHNKSFIDQAFLVKVAGYWAHSFVSVHKHAKKRTWPISSRIGLTLGQ